MLSITKSSKKIFSSEIIQVPKMRCFATDKSEVPEIPKNLLEPYQTAHFQKENGFIYDKKPFKMLLHKEKVYFWCLCGRGHSQPICDATHRFPQLKITLKPIRFQVSETKEYWLCNCKQTKNRPFCDGSHKQEYVQEACKFNYY